jgi:dUTP pyrophosphatase
MTDVKVKVKKKDKELPTPAYKTVGAAGADVCSAEDVTIRTGGRCLVSTGLYLEVPPGYECQIRPRSGLALSHGITVLNAPGTLDSDYRGELGVLLFNTSTSDYKIRKGERIAQIVIAPVVQAVFEDVEELSITDRGAGGFGSTGRA